MKQKSEMDKATRKWLNSHTSFYLGLSVDEIERLRKENSTLRAALNKITIAIRNGDPQAIADVIEHTRSV